MRTKWVAAVVALMLAFAGYRALSLRKAPPSKVVPPPRVAQSPAASVPDRLPEDRARPVTRSATPLPAPAAPRPPRGRRSVSLGAFRFLVAQDWFQTRTATPREIAFGARDGRLGVHVIEVPNDRLDAFVRRRDVSPLPGMSIRFDPALDGTGIVHGLRFTACGGTVVSSNGRGYGARFWVVRGRQSALSVSAFDAVERHQRALDALVRSVSQSPSNRSPAKGTGAGI